MRILLASAVAALLGFVAGWAAYREPGERVRVVERIVPSPSLKIAVAEQKLPAFPKPPIEIPKPEEEGSRRLPQALAGDLPKLPSAEPESGPIGLMVPEVPARLPAADLKADEALARRVVIGEGGEVVSSSDARDTTGKIGRSLVAESAPQDFVRLQSALRKSLGTRIVMSEAGSVGGSSPEIRKAEDALATQKKALDRARIDFLPNAPVLQDLEEAYRIAEKNLSDARRATARQRLNILLRPMLEG